MTSGASSARFGAARDAVTAAAAARWRLRVALLVAHRTDPVVTRYLIGKNVVFEAVHHVPPNVAAPLEAWLSGVRRALTTLAADFVEPAGDTIDVSEWLPPYHDDRGNVAVAWFARLAAHQRDGGRAALGVHVTDVRVHPDSRVRRAGATVDVVAPRDAAMGHRDRMVLARVRFPDAESAADAHQELRLDFTADVDVLGPLRRDEADVPLLDRMAMVEDYLYLVAVRLGKAADDS